MVPFGPRAGGWGAARRRAVASPGSGAFSRRRAVPDKGCHQSDMTQGMEENAYAQSFIGRRMSRR